LEEESRRYSCQFPHLLYSISVSHLLEGLHRSPSLEDGSGEPGHAIYTESSLPSDDTMKKISESESEVRECELLTTVEDIEPSYRPDGGFGYLSPEEVKIIKERVTAEYAMKEKEEESRNFSESGPLQDVMMPREEPDNELHSLDLEEAQQGLSLTEVKPSF
jgi:hypothetical protein